MTKIIDAEDIFIRKQKLNSLKQELEMVAEKRESFLNEYIGMRIIMADNPIGVALSMMAEISPILTNRNYQDLMIWDSFQVISNNLFLNKINKEYLNNTRKFILKTADKERPIKLGLNTALLWLNKTSIDSEFGNGSFVILSEITKQMNKIARFREVVHDGLGEKYIFGSEVDLYILDDYIRLSMLEDFILKRGAYDESK